jgi:threonine aldolase
MNFASDNTAGVAPAILDAIGRANAGFALGYGNDAATLAVEQRLARLFEHELSAFLVPTGTAANALAIAQLAPPWGAVLCHEEAHLIADECGAPEFFGGGVKLIGLPGVACKITAQQLAARLKAGPWGGPHHVTPAVLSLSQVTEAGTLYRIDEIRELATIAHAHGMAVHMDGARFANALARQNASPAETTWKAGIDVLSLGATKCGALAAEAVIFFDPAQAKNMADRRKRAGHLMSKHRFLAVQLDAWLTDDVWLDLARHANKMADRLLEGLVKAGFRFPWPVEANEVFVILPGAADTRLKATGASYYPWSTGSLPADVTLAPDEVLARLVTSFATTAIEVDRFVEVASAT